MRPMLMGLAVGALAVAAGNGRAWAGDAGPGGGTLWITREQRAQQLLDAGHAAAAARLFGDPRRRAYADLRAGRDAEAARLLEPLHDPDSEYNRGNALARSGALLDALKSYDAALAQAPHDRDIRRNRDLVARVLESRMQRSGQGSASSSQGGRQGNRGQSSNGQPHGSNGQGATGASGARSGMSAGSQSGQPSAASGSSAEQEAEQARQDAALAAELHRREMRSGGRSSGSRSGARGEAQGGTNRAGGAEREDDVPWPPPKSEQALALDEWLRRIPEDPGGLLRRKFLIEHMERQEGEP